jgi:Tfp pilus assembly protein PilO
VRDRRAPIIAGAVAVGVLILVMFFLVLPKMNQVSSANDQLAQAQSQTVTLQSQLAALRQAQQDAPRARETIRRVEQSIPPTADQQGLILLLQNAADQSSVDLFTITPGTPVFDAASGVSTIPASLTVNGTYFAITEFLFRVETLPRAAKVLTVSLSPTEGGGLTLESNMQVFTSDSSAGPGSSPGPTGGAGTAPTTPTTPASPAGTETSLKSGEG